MVGNSYTLKIKTADGKEYQSSSVLLRPTPDIDNVYAQYLPAPIDGPSRIQFYVDTSDPQNKTHFYRWEYEETYEIKTPYESKFYWVGGNAVTDRGVSVSDCWASDTSKNILIETSTGLLEDKITSFPIHSVPAESQAMEVKYSLLVRQFSLSEKSYNFWNTLQKVNESQGTLFDIQPGEVTGNITSVTDPGLPVLGYFDACEVKVKRAFFTPDLFDGYVPPMYASSCTDDNIFKVLAQDIGSVMQQYQNAFEILDIAPTAPPGYLLLPKPCCNCTGQGTNVKPPFWP